MNTLLAGAMIYLVILWILIIIPLLIAGIAMLIMGIKDLKLNKQIKKKRVSPVVCTVIGAIFFVVSSAAIIAPTIWWAHNYNEAIEADKSYNKRFESQSEYPNDSEEVNSETVYLIY